MRHAADSEHGPYIIERALEGLRMPNHIDDGDPRIAQLCFDLVERLECVFYGDFQESKPKKTLSLLLYRISPISSDICAFHALARSRKRVKRASTYPTTKTSTRTWRSLSRSPQTKLVISRLKQRIKRRPRKRIPENPMATALRMIIPRTILRAPRNGRQRRSRSLFVSGNQRKTRLSAITSNIAVTVKWMRWNVYSRFDDRTMREEQNVRQRF